MNVTKIILSEGYVKTIMDHYCILSGRLIFKGTECYSMGVVDREEMEIQRWWIDPEYSEFFYSRSPEEQPGFIRDWLFENGLMNDKYD